jgi:hypothetical protein
LTSSLNCLCKLALMVCAGSGGPAGQDLTALGHIATQPCGVFIVYMLAPVDTELANLLAFAILLILVVSHNSFLLSGHCATFCRAMPKMLRAMALVFRKADHPRRRSALQMQAHRRYQAGNCCRQCRFPRGFSCFRQNRYFPRLPPRCGVCRRRGLSSL